MIPRKRRAKKVVKEETVEIKEEIVEPKKEVIEPIDEEIKTQEEPEEVQEEKKLFVKCVETENTYLTIEDAAEMTGISDKGISKVLSGERKTAGGYHWEFVEV